MITDVLKFLALTDGVTTLTEMARRLDISEETLRLIIEHAAKNGYLYNPVCALTNQPEAQTKNPACLGCSGCKPMPNQPSIWHITEKGRKLLEKSGLN